MDTIGIICNSNLISRKIGYMIGLGVGMRKLHGSEHLEGSLFPDAPMKYDWMVGWARGMEYMIDHEKEFVYGIPSDLDRYNVYFASFAHPLKYIVSQLTSIPFEYFSDCRKKNEYIINLRTYEYRKREKEDHIVTPMDFFKSRWPEAYDHVLSGTHDNPDGDLWMALNDYVIYFGFYVCRSFLGKDIWTRVEEMTNKNFPPDPSSIRVYIDVRARSEYDYIRSLGGKFIRIESMKDNGSIIYDLDLDSVPVDLSLPEDDIFNPDRIYDFVSQNYK